MQNYNYFNALKEDIKNYVEKYVDLDDYTDIKDLVKELVNADYITGRENGSYTNNQQEAEEYLCHSWKLLIAAINNFGIFAEDALDKGPEFCDVLIRCYLLKEYGLDIVMDLYGNQF